MLDNAIAENAAEILLLHLLLATLLLESVFFVNHILL